MFEYWRTNPNCAAFDTVWERKGRGGAVINIFAMWLTAQFKLESQSSTADMWLVTWPDRFLVLFPDRKNNNTEIVGGKTARNSQSIKRRISTVHVCWARPMSPCSSVTSQLIRVSFYQGLSRGKSAGVQSSLPPSLTHCCHLFFFFLKAAALWTLTAAVTRSHSNWMKASK